MTEYWRFFYIINSIKITIHIVYMYYINVSEYNNLPERNNSPIQLIS